MSQVHTYKTNTVYGLRNKVTGQFRRGAFLEFYKKFEDDGVDTDELKYTTHHKDLHYMLRKLDESQELKENYEVVAFEIHVEEHWDVRPLIDSDR
jgi:hypothetical protein